MRNEDLIEMEKEFKTQERKYLGGDSTPYVSFGDPPHTLDTFFPEGRDDVTSPAHYTNLNPHGIESIQAIEASMRPAEFKGYLKGNVMKYMWRYGYKGNPKKDLEKARWYLNKLLDKVS